MVVTNIIKGIFRWTGKGVSATRVALMNLLFIVSLVLFFVTLKNLQPAPVPENAILWLNPTGNIVEQYSFNDPLVTLLRPEQATVETSLADITKAIYTAASDSRVKAMVINPDSITGIGISSINSIHRAIASFKESGKPVFAYSRGMAQHQYLFTSVADEIVIHPMAYVAINGYGAFRQYYKSALDKLLVDVHVFRVGAYKSAMEPYLRDDMSPEAEAANKQWLDGLWQNYVERVAHNRQLDPGDIDDYVNFASEKLGQVDGNTALMAKEAELVDGLGTSAEFWKYVQEQVPGIVDPTQSAVSLSEYLAANMTLPVVDSEEETVAIVTVEGSIVDGDAPPGSAGGDSIAQMLKNAKDMENVRAVVMRVNSPGGSAFASEIIREQVLALQAAGKPVVVSMGNVAASGGYWISANADEIWASPTTITGSIGIFAAVPDAHRALNKLGINSDGVGTSNIADGFDLARPLNPHIKEALQLAIEHGYTRFIDLVSTGRQLDRDKTLAAAGGRVWIGADAQNLGLVDQLGELEDAVQSAAFLGGMEGKPRVMYIEDPKWAQLGLLQRLLNASVQMFMPNDHAVTQMRDMVNSIIPVWLRFPDPRHVYLQCLECDTSLGK